MACVSNPAVDPGPHEGDTDGGEVAVVVPKGATPGSSKLALHASGGRRVLVTVPANAQPGDVLRVAVPAPRPPASQAELSRRLVAVVPKDAVPGETQLRVRVGPEESLVAVVPSSARPGEDCLQFAQDCEGRWCAELVGSQEAIAAPPPKPSGKILASVALTRVDLEPLESFQKLREAAVSAGAQVSAKIGRGTVEGLGIAGMTASEAIDKGELLLRMPLELHITPSRLRHAMPQLHAAVSALPGLCDRLRAEVSHAACLATMLGEALVRAEALAGPEAEHGTREKLEHASGVELVWARYCDALLSEDFSDHPYWCCLDNDEWARGLLAPSREYEHARAMVGELIRAHWGIMASVAPDLVGPRFCPGLLLQARLCVLSRVFRTCEKYASVPLVDFFNHSEDPSADWLWDEEQRAMVVTARRAHAAGEPITISYGGHANPLLFRTYGFTLPPSVEPSWTYVLQGVKPRAVYDKYLPTRHAELNIHMDSVRIHDSLVEALNVSVEVGQDARDFLLELCAVCARPYEGDPLLRPALAALERRRAVTPSSGAWWEELAPAGGARWEEHCIRVKMSEYLCLVAHMEAARLALGRQPGGSEGCLAAAAVPRQLLQDAFEELRRHGRFTIDVHPAP